jgi:hypothetical protein
MPKPVVPCPHKTGDVGRGCGDASRVPLFCGFTNDRIMQTGPAIASPIFDRLISRSQEAAARGDRLRELRWKNSAWLATAETIAGWNGFEIRKAGSGRSPVRKRSG